MTKKHRFMHNADISPSDKQMGVEKHKTVLMTWTVETEMAQQSKASIYLHSHIQKRKFKDVHASLHI